MPSIRTSSGNAAPSATNNDLGNEPRSDGLGDQVHGQRDELVGGRFQHHVVRGGGRHGYGYVRDAEANPGTTDKSGGST